MPLNEVHAMQCFTLQRLSKVVFNGEEWAAPILQCRSFLSFYFLGNDFLKLTFSLCPRKLLCSLGESSIGPLNGQPSGYQGAAGDALPQTAA